MESKNEDVIEKCIGKFGKYQAVIIFLVMLGRFEAEFQMYSVVFILPKTNYICFDDNAYNITNHCPCNNPEFDDSEIVSSVVSEWNLICRRTSLASLAQSLVQLGFIPGSIFCGHLSDRYGRKRMVCLSLILISVLVSLSAMVPELWMFLVVRFFIGCAIGANMSVAYIYCIELTGASFRIFTNSINLAMDILSYLSISLLAFYLREWRYLLLGASSPWFMTILYFWLLPESPRWQIAVGQTDKAIKTLTKIAQRNGKAPDNIADIVYEASKVKDSEQKSGSYLELLQTQRLKWYIILVSLLWAICNIVHFGTNQYIGRLQGSLYLNTILTGICVLPSVPIIIFITFYFKRKLSLSICFLTASTSLIIFVLTPYDYVYLNLFIVILAMLGMYIAFAQLYLYTSEVFPTVVRNSAFGIAATTGRAGSFLAPFIVNIGIEWQTMSIFITLPIVATIIIFFLPETKGTGLRNTIEEFKNASREHS